MATGVVLFITEFWRDPIGRGAMLGGILKGPQAGAIVFVFAGAFILLDRPSQQLAVSTPSLHPAPSAHSGLERPSHG
jgi:hypothetical protein